VNTHDLISAALERVDEGAVVLRETHSQNLRWANSAVTTNGDMWSATLTVIAAQELPGAGGIGVGVMSGQVNDVEAAAELANLARGAASDGTPIDHVEFPATGIDADFGATAASLDEDTSDRMVSRLGVFLDSPTAQFGYSEATRTTTYLATTAGAGHRHVQDTVRFEASARDSTGSTWWGTNSWTAGFPEAAEAQGHDLRLQRERETLEPGRYPVILSPGAVADLLIYLAWSAGARDAVEGHSVFSRPGGGTRIGELLSPRDLTVFSDPDYPGLQASPVAVVEANSSMESVFDNGLTLQRQDLITAGRLTALRASRPTAQRFDLTPVYLADNLIMVDGQGSGTLQDLIARTSDAVYINCLWYIREVDPQNLLLTGLTRDGVYRVRDGRITAALPNFRFNVAVPDLLGRIRDASGTAPCLPREWADWFTRTAMPALLVDEFNLSSPSDAR
jgi:predicted Zn-dependent protease